MKNDEKDDGASLLRGDPSAKVQTETLPNDDALREWPMDDDEYCPTCGGTGELAHDCGEDTCCCIDKDGPMCPTCGGMG